MPNQDLSHLESAALDAWPSLEPGTDRLLQEDDLSHYIAPSGGFVGGYERIFTAEGIDVGLLLVQLTEVSETEIFLESQVIAWMTNPDLIASEEIEVPGLPEARGLRFSSGNDWVRLFAAEGAVAIDVSVRNGSSEVDALELASLMLEAQLERLAQ